MNSLHQQDDVGYMGYAHPNVTKLSTQICSSLDNNNTFSCQAPTNQLSSIDHESHRQQAKLTLR